MTSTFDRWEKDPFFSAAEDVQESSDRMESTYRTWIHAIKEPSGSWNLDELRRDLQTTLGTTKWQLEEFGRAVRSSYPNSGSADDAKDRHRDFIVAIENQVKKVETSLKESTVRQGKPPLPWVRLDEGERNELALFLSGQSLSSPNKLFGKHQQGQENSLEGDQQVNNECSRSSSHLVELAQVEGKGDKFSGHRRTASASADIGSWKIAVADDVLHDSSSAKPDRPPRKIPSFSGFLNSMESSMSQLKWSKNGYKKLKPTDGPQDAGATLPRAQILTRGINTCYEKSKSCLEGCDDYEKQWYGWYGSIQRQLQRSQYHVQYSRPVQFVFSVILILCLLVLLALRAI
ncbi:uncharacterized protein LOC131010749 isoform X2 [Salvia miltiorrhiza]|uniref:uncharacterized protein LOC131010723 n=1 Tax=Salvia miltiorrhiza TaxID=226208 RepID=UPI0025AC462D|nr:uncharacterized protein LOC131010723 [Salvia miltiorrhiza]XP_057794395.1 uncharacterized protein LOC131010749 isoform X2 [Salvia miltiorrhiza]